MKPLGKCVLVTAILLCGALAANGAEEKKKKTSASPATSATLMKPAGTVIPGGSNLSGTLPGTIKIDPKLALKGKLDSKLMKHLSPAFYNAFKIVKRDYNYLCTRIPQYEAAKNLYLAKCEECRNRTYTEGEMAAAGCLPTDTLADCSYKLFRKCVGPYEVDILDMLVFFGSLSLHSKKMEEEFFNSVRGNK
jgi:hypothetical protein